MEELIKFRINDLKKFLEENAHHRLFSFIEKTLKLNVELLNRINGGHYGKSKKG
jgi:hypothetical protein